MPTRIAPRITHHRRRLEYHPGGWLVESIERSQRFGAGCCRAANKGISNPTVTIKSVTAITVGLMAEIQSDTATATAANGSATAGLRLLRATIRMSEMRPNAPANTI